jgi:homoserine O-acetyltransferase
MDLFDISDGHDSVAAPFSSCPAKVLLLAINSDFLVPPTHMSELHEALAEAGVDVSLHVMDSIHGHDSFLLETGQINTHIADFLQST